MMRNRLTFLCFHLLTMARCAAVPVDLSTKHRHRLEAIVRQHHAAQSLVMRARIILLADAGVGVHETARELDIGRATVQRWRKRWLAGEGRAFAERLCDAPRPGTPPTYEPEQICAIIALACEPPSASGRPFTHWTHAALATAASEEGIVESISRHAVGRFLREGKLKPHRTRGWINTPRDADFAAKCSDVCRTDQLDPERAAAGIVTRSIDEMTGVQASHLPEASTGLHLWIRRSGSIGHPFSLAEAVLKMVSSCSRTIYATSAVWGSIRNWWPSRAMSRASASAG